MSRRPSWIRRRRRGRPSILNEGLKNLTYTSHQLLPPTCNTESQGTYTLFNLAYSLAFSNPQVNEISFPLCEPQ